MNNFEKLKIVVEEIKFFIDEKIINEKNCNSILEEIYSVMEILEYCCSIEENTFKEEMESIKKIINIK